MRRSDGRQSVAERTSDRLGQLQVSRYKTLYQHGICSGLSLSRISPGIVSLDLLERFFLVASDELGHYPLQKPLFLTLGNLFA